MRARRATVFRVTVFPPVLGPVMTSWRDWFYRYRDYGNALKL
jgi:hypothetical protein